MYKTDNRTMSNRCVFKTYQFSLLIVRNPFQESEHYGKWLAVNESKNRGWWIPAGAVDEGETFAQAGHRECLEEAGIKVILKGLLRIDHSLRFRSVDQCRMRVIFYAEPESLEEAHNIKKVADSESLEARWVTIDDLHALAKESPGLRSNDLVYWATYLENGGHVFPLAMFGEEGELQTASHQSFPLLARSEGGSLGSSFVGNS
jgi:phosphatase NudJ